MPLLNPDTAEWLVLMTHPSGKLFLQAPEATEKHSIATAQATGHRYNLAQAQNLAKKLGSPWVVNHYHTLVTPPEHEAWLKHGKRTNWAP